MQGCVLCVWRGRKTTTTTKKLTSMNDLPAMKICQTIHNTFSHLAKHLFTRSTPQLSDFLVNAVQTSTLAELHRNRNSPGRLVHKRTVVAADVVGGAMLIEIEFSNNLLFNVGIRVGSNDLDVELAMHCLTTSHHIRHTHTPSMQKRSSPPSTCTV